MKILVCTDGSEHSLKALEKAAVIAEGCKAHEVAIIHVYEGKFDFSAMPFEGSITKEDIERFRKVQKEQEEERERILAEALEYFEAKNIKARTILTQGHPSYTIVKVAYEEGFDMIVIGSRGLGGFKKFILGSVSNAVIQEAKNCSVLAVK